MYQIPSVNKGGPRPRQTSLPGVSRGSAGGGMQVCLQCGDRELTWDRPGPGDPTSATTEERRAAACL